MAIQQIKSVCFITREYDGLAGAGGVKDVCRQLAETLVASAGLEVTLVLPRYGFMDAERLGFSPLRLPPGNPDVVCADGFNSAFDVDMNYPDEERRETVTLLQQNINGVRIILLEAERFAEKLGVYTYTEEEEKKESWQRQGSGHYDYFAMNILLQKAAMDVMILLDERPDILHLQDGHAATLAAMMRENPGYRHYFRHSGVVVTIHNAGLGYHQEVADLSFARAVTGLPRVLLRTSRLGSSFDPFMAAADYAVMNTVSENYARELQETGDDARTGWLGHRLLQRGVQLAGVTNGINPQDFDPAEPKKLGLAAAFNPLKGDLAGKRVCKEDILNDFSRVRKLAHVEQIGRLSMDADLPLCTFIGRLTTQKGVDVLLESLKLLPEENSRFQLLVLGSGDPELEEQLADLTQSKDVRAQVCFVKGYDPALATRIYAAGDFFLIPSLYEPCGLTDYIAQLLGNLPIVHSVGGLVKVLDGKTGFAYDRHTPKALAETMLEALAVYGGDPKRILNMQRAAVERIYECHTWEKVMSSYFKLYDQALAMTCRN
ncbi:MAG: glycogen/starch synthase [Desulfobulbaceae bacterium]|nr:glycogen/starch synthase [Desulfobulbaceae bacterium]